MPTIDNPRHDDIVIGVDTHSEVQRLPLMRYWGLHSVTWRFQRPRRDTVDCWHGRRSSGIRSVSALRELGPGALASPDFCPMPDSW
jgi:hypothetical protein